MAWLVRDANVLASVEIADTFRTRLWGLLGRRSLDGALLIRPARSVHTFGMRFAIDVAFCDGELRVLAVRTMKPWRIAPPVRRACVIIEAEAGAFERWGLSAGDELAVHGEGAHRSDGSDGFDGAGGGLLDRPARARAAVRRRIGRRERVRRTAGPARPADGHSERLDPLERPERMERPVLT